jgi:uncharacterized protein
MKTLLINGSSGFLGSQICKYFEKKYHIDRLNSKDYLIDPILLADRISKADIIINLAGARISLFASKRYKQVMHDSRVSTTLNLCKAIDLLEEKPELFISISAVGIYDYIHIHDETSSFLGNDFLARICKDWEDAARCNTLNNNLLIVRTGIVLSKEGGFLKSILKPFRLGLGAVIGNGEQVFPFIHIADFLSAIDFAVERHLIGIVNFVAPVNCTNKQFSVSVCRALKRPLFLTVPSVFVKTVLGDNSSMLLNGQTVIPKVLKDNNFNFLFPEIDSVVNNLINS